MACTIDEQGFGELGLVTSFHTRQSPHHGGCSIQSLTHTVLSKLHADSQQTVFQLFHEREWVLLGCSIPPEKDLLIHCSYHHHRLLNFLGVWFRRSWTQTCFSGGACWSSALRKFRTARTSHSEFPHQWTSFWLLHVHHTCCIHGGTDIQIVAGSFLRGVSVHASECSGAGMYAPYLAETAAVSLSDSFEHTRCLQFVEDVWSHLMGVQAPPCDRKTCSTRPTSNPHVLYHRHVHAW